MDHLPLFSSRRALYHRRYTLCCRFGSVIYILFVLGNSLYELILNLNICHGSWIFRLIPAADTGFAKDAAFGYKSSNLREVF